MLHSIRTFLEQFLDSNMTGWQQQLIKNWHTTVGDLAHKMTLEKIDGSTLIIGVYDAAWMQELSLLSSLLIKKINKSLGEQHITALRFKRVVRKKNVESGTKTKFPTTLPEIPLTSQEKNALADLDQGLADSLAGYRKKIHQMNTK